MKKRPFKKFKQENPIKKLRSKLPKRKATFQKQSRSGGGRILPTLEFPSNFRIIPEGTSFSLVAIVWNKYFLVSFVSTFIIAAVALQGVDLAQQVRILERIRNEREQVRREIVYWEGVVEEHQDYRDGYFKLALLEYRLGNKEKAKKYIDETLIIDPNYKPAQNFAERIEGGS